MIPEIQGRFISNSEEEEDQMLMAEMQAAEQALRINQVAGVIDSAEVTRLRKLVFRSTRGKSFVYTQEIGVPEGAKQEKSVYIIIFWGSSLKDRIERIADSFTGKRYDLPQISEITSEKVDQMK